MAIMKNSDYFVPPTQCNAAGVPQVRTRECICAPLFASAGVLKSASLQGGYLDMSAFIAEQGFKTGKGGYQKARLVRQTGAVGLALPLIEPVARAGLPSALRSSPGWQHALHLSRCCLQVRRRCVVEATL